MRTPGDSDELVARAKRLRERARKCTGDPTSCRQSYSVPTEPEMPICRYTGADCDNDRRASRQ